MSATTEARGADALDSVFVGRQPILDDRLATVGYELLFRATGGAAAAEFTSGDGATARVISNAVAEIGLDDLVGDDYAFVNVTRTFLVEHGLLDCLPPDRTVLEIVESVVPDDEVIEGIRTLRGLGYTIALDDFRPDGPTASLRDHVEVIKYDLSAISIHDLSVEIQRDHAAGREVIVERVETAEQHAAVIEAGADFVQGYFFARPMVVESNAIPTNTVALVRLIGSINQTDVSMERVVDMLTRDVALSVKILRVVNAASFGLSARVDSIQHAAVLIGRDRLRSLASLVMMASIDDQPEALVAMSLTRAKFCELLAATRGVEDPLSAFTVGMLSLLPAMTLAPMKTLIKRIGVSDEISDALLKREGPYGELLELAIAVEDPYRFDVTSDPDVVAAHRAAVRWSLEVGDVVAA